MLSRLTCTIVFFVVLLIIFVSMLIVFMLPNQSNSDSVNDETESIQSNTFTATSNECYPGEIGKNKLATRKTLSGATRDVIERNAYTLTGNAENDGKHLKAIKAQSCEGLIPVVVIKMSPDNGQLQLSDAMKMTVFYQPESKITSWKEYDKVLNKYAKQLSNVPSIVILEPNLLMLTYEADFLQYRWSNELYETNFLQRAVKLVR